MKVIDNGTEQSHILLTTKEAELFNWLSPFVEKAGYRWDTSPSTGNKTLVVFTKQVERVPVKEFAVIKRSNVTEEQAKDIAKLLNVPSIYMEGWNDVETHTLDEIQGMVDRARDHGISST